ncbi:MAG: hypothetical protein LBP90_01530 [Burkholderiales bacterium]|jgi:hypothetical protein|nr:hypothetical protein [Burkholderiales bacterium]
MASKKESSEVTFHYRAYWENCCLFRHDRPDEIDFIRIDCPKGVSADALSGEVWPAQIDASQIVAEKRLRQRTF